MGNRKQLNSTVPAIPSGVQMYDANDRLATDNYDPAGNTVSSGGIVNTYDFENHLVQHGAVTVVYDGDGNRVSKTAGGVTTKYLVSEVNPTGYAQVIDELQGGSVVRHYSWGLELISQKLIANGQVRFYSYDGHGSVRQLTDTTGNVTDSYTYDAFGNLIEQTGTTPNLYLYAGQQFDPDLGLYYNRARYLDVRNGRFWGMDTVEGQIGDPRSLHLYAYANADPVILLDPSGHDSLDELMTAAAVNVTLTTLSNVLVTAAFLGDTAENPSFDGALLTVHGNVSGRGWTLEGGVDLLYQNSTHSWYYALNATIGTNPLGTLPESDAGRGPGYSVGLGPVFNMPSVDAMKGLSVSAIWPLKLLALLQPALFNGPKAWGVLSQFAKNVRNVNWSHASVGFGIGDSGASFAQFYLRSNIFSSTFGGDGKFYPVNAGGFDQMFQDIRNAVPEVFSIVESGDLATGNAMVQNSNAIGAALDADDKP